MSISVQELDNTVRALFEGKGDLVSDLRQTPHIPPRLVLRSAIPFQY
jgi:hypothetical protein